MSVLMQNVSMEDSTFTIVDNSDNDKKAIFQLSSVTSGQTRTITIPDSNVTLGSATISGTTFSETLKIGRDADNLIDFTTDNEITFRVGAADELRLDGTALAPETSDGLALGTSSLMWSDLFLASGSVVNFDNGDVTLTHSSNTITVAGGTLATAALTASTGTFSGILKTDDATEATTTTDGSLQTDGGLSVVKSAVIGDDLDLLSNSAIFKIGSDQPFTLTHSNSNNTVMATTDHRLAFGDTGEYISGDGTDLKIISSGDVDITGTLVDITGALTASGIIKTDDTTEATSTTDGSLQTDGGLSVAKDIIAGNDVKLLSDSAVLSLGADNDATLTHDGTTGLTIAANPLSLEGGAGGVDLEGAKYFSVSNDTSSAATVQYRFSTAAEKVYHVEAHIACFNDTDNTSFSYIVKSLAQRTGTTTTIDTNGVERRGTHDSHTVAIAVDNTANEVDVNITAASTDALKWRGYIMIITNDATCTKQ